MKNKNLNIYYDEAGDILEIRMGNPTVSYMKDLGNDIFERIDNETGEIKGLVIMNFKKRAHNKLIEIPVQVKLDAEV